MYVRWRNKNVLRLIFYVEISGSNGNVYQAYFLGVEGGWCLGLTTSPPSRADCLEIRTPETPGTLRAWPGLYRECFTF
jgi:hypothetical protein